MSIIVAQFDGKVFVPEEPVDLPAGTKVSIPLPGRASSTLPGFTSAEDAKWQEIVAHIRAGEPDPPTVDEAMREIRMRP